jgi:hypothetical protein
MHGTSFSGICTISWPSMNSGYIHDRSHISLVLRNVKFHRQYHCSSYLSNTKHHSSIYYILLWFVRKKYYALENDEDTH